MKIDKRKTLLFTALLIIIIFSITSISAANNNTTTTITSQSTDNALTNTNQNTVTDNTNVVNKDVSQSTIKNSNNIKTTTQENTTNNILTDDKTVTKEITSNDQDNKEINTDTTVNNNINNQMQTGTVENTNKSNLNTSTVTNQNLNNAINDTSINNNVNTYQNTTKIAVTNSVDINLNSNNLIITDNNSTNHNLKTTTVTVDNNTITTYTIQNNTTSSIKQATYPTSYDLRDYGYVTSVKTQGSDGNCWAFASLASLESCILKYNGTVYDLSENNMKNVMSSSGKYGWLDYVVNDGGIEEMAVGYLASYTGAVLESQDPYFENSTYSIRIKSSVHIKDVYYLPTRTSYTDNNAIKAAILNYGGIYTTMYMDDYYLSEDETSYYLSDKASSTNHAVCIVGWDDNYSRYNFYTTPPGDGAFIVKNSWGTDWGDNGYFYVSYYDKKVTPYMTFNMKTDNLTYADIYQYDMSGCTYGGDTYNGNSIYFGNEYTATNNNPLAAIGTYSTTDQKTYNMYVYVNNVLKYQQSGSFAYAGYHTIKLNNYVNLTKGNVFKIIMAVFTNGTSMWMDIPVQLASSCNNTPSGTNSYMGYSLSSLENTVSLGYVVCLKALTINTSTTSLTQTKTVVNPVIGTVGNTITLQANITDLKGNTVNGGKVVFKVNGITLKDSSGNVLYATVTKGIAQLKYTIQGSWSTTNSTIQAIYSGLTNTYSQSAGTNTVNVIKRTASITLTKDNDLVKAAEVVTFTATVKDSNGTLLNSGIVTFKFQGKAITDSNGNVIKANVTNGKATLYYTIPNGISAHTYTITAIYGSNAYNKAETTTSLTTIKVETVAILNPISMTRGDTTMLLTGTVRDENGNIPVGTTKISVKLGGITIAHISVTKGTINNNITLPYTLSNTYYTISITTATNYGYTGTTAKTTLTIKPKTATKLASNNVSLNSANESENNNISYVNTSKIKTKEDTTINNIKSILLNIDASYKNKLLLTNSKLLV